jgi:hypothetical protein
VEDRAEILKGSAEEAPWQPRVPKESSLIIM